MFYRALDYSDNVTIVLSDAGWGYQRCATILGGERRRGAKGGGAWRRAGIIGRARPSGTIVSRLWCGYLPLLAERCGSSHHSGAIGGGSRRRTGIIGRARRGRTIVWNMRINNRYNSVEEVMILCVWIFFSLNILISLSTWLIMFYSLDPNGKQ